MRCWYMRCVMLKTWWCSKNDLSGTGAVGPGSALRFLANVSCRGVCASFSARLTRDCLPAANVAVSKCVLLR